MNNKSDLKEQLFSEYVLVLKIPEDVSELSLLESSEVDGVGELS